MEERVQKIIAQSGMCSRRKAEALIEDGKVEVNGTVITIGSKADGQKDTITVEGNEITKEKFVYYILHKPTRYITTSSDLFDRKKVLDLVPSKPRVFSIGRLDRDTSGLLLLTNDGDFANKIMHPRYEVRKTYIAILDGPFNKNAIGKAKEGVRIDGHLVRADIIILEPDTVAVSVETGIHKVVKRLLKSLGYYVRQLHRTHIGDLALDIEEGKWRTLEESEKKLIFKKTTITKETYELS